MPATTVPGDTAAGPLYDHRKLRAWRDEAGVSRERVAADLELSAAWLQNLELGGPRGGPSLDTLVRLARYYGHEPGELLL